MDCLETRVVESIKDTDKESYNSIQDKGHPFFDYEFLYCLEESGCIGKGTGWDPRYILIYEKDKLIGSLSFFIKTDSYGEFIFDWEWARAYEQAGLDYYPKGVIGIPFTPTTGRRIIVHPDYDFNKCAIKLIEGALKLAQDLGLSSIHCLFVDEDEQKLFTECGFMERITHQYHWHNRDYTDFDSFLADLKSSKRKQIKKERKSIYESDIEIEILRGNEINKEHIASMWQFYFDTHSRKWGNAYLNYNFFDLIHDTFSDKIVMVMAKEKDNWLGGSFNFIKDSTLFGRYWGTNCEVDNLHFECCYYSLIDYSISNSLKRFEAGAQGEHKFLRGFSAVPIYSSHIIFNESASHTIGHYLENEKIYMLEIIDSYNKKSPLKYLCN